jgi:hypothetical protein
MTKYPLIKLLSESFGGFKPSSKSKKKRLTKNEKQSAEQRIHKAKEKRSAKKAKRAHTRPQD